MADELDDELEYSFDVGSPDGVATGLDDEHNFDSDEEQAQDRPAKKQKRDKVGLSEKRKSRMLEDVRKKQELGKLEPAMIADFIAAKVSNKKGNEDLSALELQDLSVPQAQIVDVASFSRGSDLENVASFFKEQNFDKLPKNHLVLVLSMSAVRVCDVARALKPASKYGALKLINKNKLQYDKKGLNSPAYIAVSTPGRTDKLAREGVLDLDRVKHVVIDATFLDAKKNAVWDLDETMPLLATLAKKGAKFYVY